MPCENKLDKPSVWNKAAEWFQKPFRKRNKVYFDTDSEDYSSSFESESDSESYSESDSDICLKKKYIAGVSSQARLATPEQQSLNLRYPLRKNPKPSLKGLEAKKNAELAKRKIVSKPKASALKKSSVGPKGQTRQQKPKNETKQESISAPSAPPLYPSLPPSPSPVLPGYQPQSLSNPNFRYGKMNDQTFDNIHEAQALAEQAVQILQGVAPRTSPFHETPTIYNTRGFRNLAKLAKSIHLKYNCNLRDASRWAQQILDQGIDPTLIVDDQIQPPLVQNCPENYDQFFQQRVNTSTPPLTSNPFATIANDPITPPRTTQITSKQLTADDFILNPQPSNCIGNSFSSQETTEAARNTAFTPFHSFPTNNSADSPSTFNNTSNSTKETYLTNPFLSQSTLDSTIIHDYRNFSNPHTAATSIDASRLLINPFDSTFSTTLPNPPLFYPKLPPPPCKRDLKPVIDPPTESTIPTHLSNSGKKNKNPSADRTSGSIKKAIKKLNSTYFTLRRSQSPIEEEKSLGQPPPLGPSSQHTAQQPRDPLIIPFPLRQQTALANQPPIMAGANPPGNPPNPVTMTDLLRIFGSQQDNQTMVLLQNITPFSGASPLKGSSNPRFETWIRTFESIVDMGNFDDAKKIKLLSSKFTNVAAETLDDFIKSRPNNGITYAAAKEHLMQRFHGTETRELYEKEYRSCVKQPSESILDYAHRLKKIFKHVYPLTDYQRNIPDVINMQEQMLKDKFTSGLPIKLREKVKFKSFATFEDLIKAATKYDVAIQEIEDEKRQIEIVSHIAGCNRSEQKTDPEITDAIRSLQEQTKELINEVKESKKYFNSRNKETDDRNLKERNDGTQRPPQQFNYAPQAVYQPPTANFVHPNQPSASYPQSFAPQNQYSPYIPQSLPNRPVYGPVAYKKFNNSTPFQSNDCKRCGQIGHFAKNCTAPAPLTQQVGPCHNCGRLGHLIRDCRSPRNAPQPQGN